ncbi:hypothetical protein XENTR_v10021464 [Xenopus tropicalis]|uniref:Galectin n=1 Tax=Xenopus tropicalis TaxID=8364 RepID=Q5I0A7_XENTR|eukprot:NP_001011449.1 lectin, galactoside-binding, soluble, 4, gene 1 [Xenopus tropicalis]
MAYVAAPGYQPFYNPAIPFRTPIHGGLRAGMSVYIQGTIPNHITRFAVNFTCGQFDGSDIACHFNPRFDGKDKVVFNSLIGGSWGSEEKKKDSFPFRKGKSFDLAFMINQSAFEITVNGSSFYKFKHRMPLERVNSLQVSGDVTVQSLTIAGGGGGMPAAPMPAPSFPHPGGVMPLPVFPAGNLPVMGGPVYNPPVPYYGSIQGGMSPRKTVIIRGFIPEGAERFHINFKAGSSNDVALHFNPRLTENVVVRNSRLGGSWGQEERNLSYNPFRPGQYFDISIRCGMDRFTVFVNGQHFCDFAHRYSMFQMLDRIEVEGNVVLSLVQI